jgi:hypothetical protein
MKWFMYSFVSNLDIRCCGNVSNSHGNSLLNISRCNTSTKQLRSHQGNAPSQSLPKKWPNASEYCTCNDMRSMTICHTTPCSLLDGYQRFWRARYYRLSVLWTLKMGAVGSIKTFELIYQISQRHIPEDWKVRNSDLIIQHSRVRFTPFWVQFVKELVGAQDIISGIIINNITFLLL